MKLSAISVLIWVGGALGRSSLLLKPQHNLIMRTKALRTAELRRFLCTAEEEDDVTVCSVVLKRNFDAKVEVSTAQGEGCFAEKTEKGAKVVYCPTYCRDAMTAYLISKRPASNSKCIQYFNYMVEERDGQWYLWRSGRCLRSEIMFDVGCLFDYPEEDAKDLRQYIESRSVEGHQ